MEDAKEFESMISFYHGLGMIIKHRSTVVLKAQWLIDLFKQLITIPPFNKQVGKNVIFERTTKKCSINRPTENESDTFFNKSATNATAVTL